MNLVEKNVGTPVILGRNLGLLTFGDDVDSMSDVYIRSSICFFQHASAWHGHTQGQ
jgi:hypothetical protein